MVLYLVLSLSALCVVLATVSMAALIAAKVLTGPAVQGLHAKPSAFEDGHDYRAYQQVRHRFIAITSPISPCRRRS